MGLFGDIAGAVVSPINSLIEGANSRKNMLLQNRMNKDEAELAYTRQKEMFNLANQYNSPAQQMDRYKAAGLNPNLIYGSGTSSNAPNVLPQYRAPALQANAKPMLQLSNVLGEYLHMQQMREQLNIMKAERRIKEANAGKAESGKPYWDENEGLKNANLYNSVYPSALKSWLAEQDLKMWADKTPAGNFRSRWTMAPEMMSTWMMNWRGRYERPYGELEKINSTIAYQNALKDLKQLDIENYLPPWIRAATGAIGTIGNLGKGLIGKGKNIIKGVDTYTKTANFGNRTQSLKSVRYNR